MRLTPAVDIWGRCVGGMIIFCYSHSPTAVSLRHRNLKERGGRASLSLSLFLLSHSLSLSLASVSISNSLYKKSHQRASDRTNIYGFKNAFMFFSSSPALSSFEVLLFLQHFSVRTSNTSNTLHFIISLCWPVMRYLNF